MSSLINSDPISAITKEIRLKILQIARDCGHPVHIGGSLSIVDFLAVLYQDFLRFDPQNPQSDTRDIFILSKGHCVLGHLATLNFFGVLSDDELSTFQNDGSDLIAHPVKNLSFGIEASTGSLGQGLSYGLGMAHGFKKRNLDRKVYVVVGDGECNEGSIWESAMLGSELQLDNITVFVDNNGHRNDGLTSSYTQNKLAGMWESFGWNVYDIDGHSPHELRRALQARNDIQMPKAIVAKTTKGKGFDFMESNNDWHHNRVTEKIYQQALKLNGENN